MPVLYQVGLAPSVHAQQKKPASDDELIYLRKYHATRAPTVANSAGGRTTGQNNNACARSSNRAGPGL